MTTALNRIGVAVLLLSGLLPLSAQEGPRGHWNGSVQVPGKSIGMEVDLDKGPNGWTGSISIPEQNSSGIPLDSIACSDGKCSFRIKGVPGDPTFTGTLSADGKTMTGDLKQGGGTFPFKFNRTGEPKVEQAKPRPALSEKILGLWEGTLEGPGLRLELTLSNDAAGGKAVLKSLDQGGVEIPASSVEQNAAKLTLEVKMVGGKYEAELNQDGSELSGTWTQGGKEMPLKLKKAKPAAKR